MPSSRHFLAAGLAGLTLAFGAAACDNDDDRPSSENDAPLNTDTPQQDVDTTAAPSGSDPEVRTGRTDGE
jgi:hypothetical protein